MVVETTKSASSEINGGSIVVKRLLGLFPVQIIRKQWPDLKSKTKEEAISAVVKAHPRSEIYDFVKQFVGLTKQNVYVLHTENFKKLPDQFLEKIPLLSSPIEKKAGEYFYLADLIYDTFTRLPGEAGEDIKLLFKWPVRITVAKDLVTVRCTIMEKHVQSYFPEGSLVFVRSRSMEETDIVKSVRDEICKTATCETCDLNKGIKALWETGAIDAPSARYKLATSTQTSAMDGDLLIKRDLPEKYKELIKVPLLKTVFKILDDSDKHLSHFSINPSNGEIGFPMFSETEKAVDHVIREILRNN